MAATIRQQQQRFLRAGVTLLVLCFSSSSVTNVTAAVSTGDYTELAETYKTTSSWQDDSSMPTIFASMTSQQMQSILSEVADHEAMPQNDRDEIDSQPRHDDGESTTDERVDEEDDESFVDTEMQSSSLFVRRRQLNNDDVVENRSRRQLLGFWALVFIGMYCVMH